MPRPCQRVRLENGFRLDINRLARRGFIRPGARTGPVGIRWTYNGEPWAIGWITADMQGEWDGSFRIWLGNLDQRITLVARPRHYGGYQWYFMCPRMHRRASVLWMPPGAREFCSRQAWRRQVAYASQFLSPTDRAWRGKERIKSRLIGEFDPDDWDLPPKPKWMRWRTYNRQVDKFDRFEAFLDQECALAAAKLMLRWGGKF